jgi:predicted nucleic acid-binding protein
MIVFDAGVLQKLFSHKTTREDRKKLDHLLRTLEAAREKVIIPTPALAEYLARAGAAAPQIVEELRKRSAFVITAFDQRAAIECALAINRDLSAGDKRGGVNTTWAKAKFDRQIVAIARANSARQIYTEDNDVKRLAKRESIQALSVGDIELPASDRQENLDLGEPEQS